MPETFIQSRAIHLQEWEGACDDGNYGMADRIAADQISRLPENAQLELIRSASLGGFDVTVDAVRLHALLSERVLAGGTPLDQSIFADLTFLETLIVDQGDRE